MCLVYVLINYFFDTRAGKSLCLSDFGVCSLLFVLCCMFIFFSLVAVVLVCSFIIVVCDSCCVNFINRCYD